MVHQADQRVGMRQPVGSQQRRVRQLILDEQVQPGWEPIRTAADERSRIISSGNANTGTVWPPPCRDATSLRS